MTASSRASTGPGAPSLPRPQPVGLGPLPAAWLLLPDVPGVQDVLDALRVGVEPTAWPAGLAFCAAARAGDVEGALLLLGEPSDPVLRYDRFVLQPTADGLAELAVDLPDAWQPLLAAAAFSAGLVDTAPDPAALDGELRAVVLLTRAADALEHGTEDEARTALAQAVEAARPASPALAATLLGTLAGLDPVDRAAQRYAEALALLPTGAQTQVRAELLFGRATALQATGRPEVLREAVRCYQQALVVFRRDTHPMEFAEAQTNLALCHLATPMVEAGDALRLGIAVQALRDALTVWDRASFPEQWASVTLNLANALQYRPSAHQQENLAEAVEHYEELLAGRDPAADPLGVARVLANQGNALAHLGIGEHAVAKLRQAQELFAGAGDHSSASAVDATLAELEAVRRLTGPDAVGAGVRA